MKLFKKLTIKVKLLILLLPTLFLNLLLVLLMEISSWSKVVYALDWNNESWINLACPKNIIGTWQSRNGKNTITFENQSFIYKPMKGKKIKYFHNSQIKVINSKFIDLSLKPKNPKKNKPIYLKIRPHLAFKELNSGLSECLIKVFRFNSKTDSQHNKYKSWDIYKKLK